MNHRETATAIIERAIDLAHCKESVRGRKQGKKILRETAQVCAKGIDDKRLKGTRNAARRNHTTPGKEA